jgi:hypothetical protein
MQCQMLDWMKLRLSENKETTMIKPNGRPANIGEVAYFQDTKTGDYSLSLHGAIIELTAENRRLQNMVDDLLNKIEYLRCAPDLQAFGSA